jgi:AcrR family transcriptional regulator
MARSKAYHHGDLRHALIAEALSLIASRGIGALTVREVARRAGVSHAASYRHFADRAALIAAVAEEGFRGMLAAMQGARGRARTPAAQFQALGVAYVEYAAAHPAILRVMFSPEVADKSRHAGLKRAADALYGLLVESIRRGQGAGLVAKGDPEDLAFTAWSLVHGCATLIVDGQLAGESPKRLAEASTRVLFEGLRAR